MSKKHLVRHLLIVYLLTVPFLLFAQQKKLSGTVYNEKNEPLREAAVLNLSNGKNSKTDSLGRFSIESNIDSGNITVSHVGYLTLTVMLKSADQKIVLTATSKDLDEVIIVGYGTTTKRDLTGSVAKAPIEDMKKAPVGNYMESLQGRSAGVNVSSGDGQPGSIPNITIRGGNSLTQSNSPLYVIDGFPIENPDPGALNQADIENFEILKDASATAVYGARGANGVVIITTKSGKVGAPKLTLNVYEGVQSLIKKMDVLSPYDFIRLMIERDSLSNTTVKDSLGVTRNRAANYFLSDNTLESYKNVKGTNFQDLIFRPSFFSNYDLSISGGDKNTKYMVSGNYFNQNGIIINSDYKRYQGRLNLDQTISSKLKTGIRANYSSEILNGQPGNYLSQAQPSTMSLFASVWASRPVSPVNSTGDEVVDLADEDFDPTVAVSGTSDYRMNPVTNQENSYNRTYRKNLTLNTNLDWQIIDKHLSLRVNIGLVNRNFNNATFFNSKTVRGNPMYGAAGAGGPKGTVSTSNSTSYSNENILTYKNRFGKHGFDVTGVFSLLKNKTSNNGFSASNIQNESLGVNALKEGLASALVTGASNSGLQSYTGRVNYNYNSRYYATVTFRADGSSKFAPGNRWGYFPSGALKWNVMNESFLDPWKKVLNELSLRVTYGKTGNNRVDDFAYLSGISQLFNYGSVFNGTLITGAILDGLANPLLKWETTGQWNAGIDVSAFQNRISLTIDAYKKKTTDLLLNAQMPGSSGYTSAVKNVGDLENKGLEFTLNTVNIANNKFKWTSTFNISFNKNKILNLAENQQTLSRTVNFDVTFNSFPFYISSIGQQAGMMYGLVYDGLYQYSDFDYTTSINTAARNVGSAGSHYVLKTDRPTNGDASVRGAIQPGDVKYKDLNGDGVIDSDDYTVIGRSQPKHFGGFGNNFDYGPFSLNVFLQWSYGNNILNANRIMFEGNPNSYNYYNQFATMNNRWTPDNQNTDIPRAYGIGPHNPSSRFIEDGSYLRLKTVSFSYQIADKIAKKLKVKGIRVYASGQNLLTFTNYSGPDPEVNTTGNILTGGFDYSPYPRAKTIVGGLTVNF